jgi:hypothetical protein
LAACASTAVLNPYRGETPPCPFYVLTGLYCPICGASRCVYALTHGHPGQAWSMNPLFLVLLPLLVWQFVAWSSNAWGGPRLWKLRSRRWVVITGATVFVVFGLARNVAALHGLLGPA